MQPNCHYEPFHPPPSALTRRAHIVPAVNYRGHLLLLECPKQLGLAELTTEVGDARGDGGQAWQAFQNGFIPQRLKFFAQFVGDISKARFQEFQGCRAQRFPLAFDSTFDPAFDPASSFNVGDVFHTLCVFVLRMFKVKFAFQFAW